MSEVQDNFKPPNICVMRFPEGEKEGKQKKKIFDEI